MRKIIILIMVLFVISSFSYADTTGDVTIGIEIPKIMTFSFDDSEIELVLDVPESAHDSFSSKEVTINMNASINVDVDVSVALDSDPCTPNGTILEFKAGDSSDGFYYQPYTKISDNGTVPTSIGAIYCSSSGNSRDIVNDYPLYLRLSPISGIMPAPFSDKVIATFTIEEKL